MRVLFFLFVFLSFATRGLSQTIQATITHHSDPNKVYIAIKNNSASTISGNLSSVGFTLLSGEYFIPDNKKFIPTSTGSTDLQQYYNFGYKYDLTWVGSYAITLTPNQELDLFEFTISDGYQNNMPIRIDLIGGNFELPALFSVVIDGSETAEPENRFYLPADAGASVSNNEIRSQVSLPSTITSLPVKLISLSASNSDNGISIQWTTTEETNSSKFEIQHSLNTEGWDPVGYVNASVESRTVQQYNFQHRYAQPGTNYYRLKMIDVDNTFAYSNILSVTKEGELNVYPNPVSSVLNIRATSSLQKGKLKIHDLNGIQVLGISEFEGSKIDLSNLKGGKYVLRIEQNSGEQLSKIIIKE